jgi:RNA polymerase sigma-70 factor, ECF subfamily
VTSDRELVHRAQQGDIGAFSALARKHQDAVYRLAVRMVGSDAAEDVAQAAFLKAWQEIGRFAGTAAFGTWLYRIATNLCLDHLRKTARFRPAPLEDLASTTSDECDVAEMDVVAAEQEERQAVLSRALAALPSEDRLLLALRVGEQLSYDEIAGLLELNPSTVGTRLYRVRARLHRLAQQYLTEGVEESDGLR